MRIKSKTTTATNGVLELSANIWSKWALTWICFGQEFMMSSSRPFFAERTTCKQQWRRTALTEQIASSCLDLTSWLTLIWNHGSLRLIWVHRWQLILPLICRSSQILWLIRTIWSAWRGLIERKNRSIRSNIEWRVFTAKERRVVLVKVYRAQVSNHLMDQIVVTATPTRPTCSYIQWSKR